MILFGARPRGDHRADPDIDLLIVCRDGAGSPHSKVKATTHAYFQNQTDPLEVDIQAVTRDKFDYCRRARNHVTRQALRDGVIMSGERLDYAGQYYDGYPDSWPDVDVKDGCRQRIGAWACSAERLDTPLASRKFTASTPSGPWKTR